MVTAEYDRVARNVISRVAIIYKKHGMFGHSRSHATVAANGKYMTLSNSPKQNT